MGLKFNRKREERLADPRATPLSHDLGAICAGIAASAERGQRPPHPLSSQEDADFLKARFPIADKGCTPPPGPKDPNTALRAPCAALTTRSLPLFAVTDAVYFRSADVM